jgi:hypothetical protein
LTIKIRAILEKKENVGNTKGTRLFDNGNKMGKWAD